MGMTAESGGGIPTNENFLLNGIPHPASPGAPFHKGAWWEGTKRSPRATFPKWKARAGSIGSANSGAVVKPHQPQFLRTQGPCGPGKNRTQALLILRAGTSALTNQERVPRNGVRGKRPMGLGGALAEP